MKSVLISIQPKWCELIVSGKKSIEVRKTRPKLETPFKCYIYKTKKRKLRDITYKGEEIWGGGSQVADKTMIISCCDLDGGKVIGEFVCDRIDEIKCKEDGFGNYWHEWSNDNFDYLDMCLSENELENYLCLSYGYGWHISDLKIYDKPKELSAFRKHYEYDDEGFIKCSYTLCPHRW